jgi:hypothetical protein
LYSYTSRVIQLGRLRATEKTLHYRHVLHAVREAGRTVRPAGRISFTASALKTARRDVQRRPVRA